MSPPALTSAGEEAEDARGVDLAGLGVTGVHHRLILVSSEPKMTRVGLDGVDRSSPPSFSVPRRPRQVAPQGKQDAAAGSCNFVGDQAGLNR